MKEMTFNDAAKLCRIATQPIVIPVDGNSKVYLMSEEIYNAYEEAKEYEEVMAGFEEIEQGKGLDGEMVFKELEQKYGF